MKKIQRILAIIALCAMTLSLAACGGGAGSSGSATPSQAKNTASAPAAAGDKVTVSYWTTNRHDQAYMTPLIEEFNKTNDHIFIDYQVYADNYKQMLDLAFSTNSAPDIFQIVDPLYDIFDKGYMLDLTPYMTDDFKARFGDGAFVDGINSVDGKIYSVPYTASAARLFYNQDIFDRVGIKAPPTTLDELVADATLVTEKLGGEGIYGFSGNFKSAASAVTRSIDEIVMRSGGTRAGFDFKNGKYDFTSYKPVLEAYTKIFSTGVCFPGSESLDIDPLRTQFAAGNIAMYISVSHAEPGVYASQFKTDVNWNCAPLPTVSGKVEGKQQLTFGGNNLALNATTKNPKEAFEVFEFLHSDDVMCGYYESGLGTVMIKSVIDKATPPATIQKMPNLAIDSDDQNWPAMPSSVIVEGKDYSSVCVEAIFGMTKVDDAIADLNTRYNAAYDKVVNGGVARIQYPKFDPLHQDLSK